MPFLPFFHPALTRMLPLFAAQSEPVPQQSTGERMRSALWRQRNAYPRFTVRPIAIEALWSRINALLSVLRLPTPANFTVSQRLASIGIPAAA